MVQRSAEWSQAFEALKSQGEEVAWNDLMAEERNWLFDYIMRMTGQEHRAVDTADEAIASLSSAGLEDCEDHEQALVMLYKTARKFAADVWNADVSRLENTAYGASNDLQQVETALRQLPGMKRETLLLRHRYLFEEDEVAEILGLSPTMVTMQNDQAIDFVDKKSHLGDDVQPLLRKLLSFEPPPRSAAHTQDLSILMRGVNRSRGFQKRLGRRWVLGLVVMCCLVLVGFFAVKWMLIGG